MRPLLYHSLSHIVATLICITSWGQSDLQQVVDKHIAHPYYRHAAISISVMDMETNELIASVNPDMSLVPASSLKLITTLCALDMLGPDYTYKTYIMHSGEIDPDGTLTGDIHIIGSGDPTWGSPRVSLGASSLPFRQLKIDIGQAIRDYGITCIDGKIIADESIFDSYPISPSWQWNDLGNYYASGAWGININENEYYIYFKRDRGIGYRSKLYSYEPYIPGLILENEVNIDSSHTSDNAYVFGGPYDFKKRIVGTIPLGKGLFRIKGSIPDPPTFVAYHIRDQLQRYQISSSGYRAKYKPNKERLQKIKSYESVPLSKIVKLTNFHSVNLYAESIIKTIGHEKRNQGSGGAGLHAIYKHLRKKGLNLTALHMEDGSGLSARNIVSSHLMCQILNTMYEDVDREILLESLPHPGSISTVQGVSAGNRANSHIWVKSGSMERIQTFSGYIQSKSGRWLCFTIMANGLSVKNKKIRPLMGKLMREIYARA